MEVGWRSIHHSGDNGEEDALGLVRWATECALRGKGRKRAFIQRPKPSCKRLEVDYTQEKKWLATDLHCSRLSKTQTLLNNNICEYKRRIPRALTGGSSAVSTKSQMREEVTKSKQNRKGLRRWKVHEDLTAATEFRKFG